jgi:hypothetical protein
MIRKSVIILICFLSVIFISLAEVFPEIPQNSYNLAETNHDNGNSFGEHLYGSTGGFQNLNPKGMVPLKGSGFLSSIPQQQTEINLANTNDTSSVEDYSVGASSSGTNLGGPSANGNLNYRFRYNGNSYTINFLNINYGDLFEKRLSERLIGAESNCYPQDLKNTLKRLAERRRIQEMEQKENLQLLKQIALG